MDNRGEELFDDALDALDEGALVKACRLLEQVVALDPTDVEAANLLARTYRDREQPEVAERTLARLCEVVVDDVPSLIELADVRLALGDPRGASVPIRRALMLQPNNAEVLSLLGNAFQDLGHRDEAARAYQASLDSNPFAGEVWYNLALVHDQRGDTMAAAQAWRSFLSCGPDDEDRAFALAELARLES